MAAGADHRRDAFGGDILLSSAIGNRRDRRARGGIRYLFHRPGDEVGLSVERNNQQMRREVTPVIETGEIEDALRRSEDRRVEFTLRQRRANPGKASGYLVVGEGVAVHSGSLLSR